MRADSRSPCAMRKAKVLKAIASLRPEDVVRGQFNGYLKGRSASR